MKLNIHLVLLTVGGTLLVTIVICAPNLINDKNGFLKDFVGEPLLSALGVILAINLASLAQLHLELNKIEEARRQVFLTGARREIRSSARWMVWLFVASIVVACAKPLVAGHSHVVALVNALAIFMLAFYILIMADIIDSVFELKPQIERTADAEADPK